MCEPRGKIKLFGIGMDDSGEDVYLTNSDDYQLVRGSSETHRKMQERAREFIRLVKSHGWSMDNISRSECSEILCEMGMVPEAV